MCGIDYAVESPVATEVGFPRALLLTYFAPNTRYAGGEAIRKIVQRLPAGTTAWAYLRPERDPNEAVKVRRIQAIPRMLHWRLRGGLLDYWSTNQVQARSLAAKIWRDAQSFAPQVIWILPELEAVNIGWHLHCLSGLPLHATIYDAHEFSRNICVPYLYFGTYIKNVSRLLGAVDSADAVSGSLLNHVENAHRMSCAEQSMVFPPSVPAEWMSKSVVEPQFGSAPRKIGFAGAFRVSPRQWQEFLSILGALPFTFEVVAFAVPDQRPIATASANVTVRFLDYAPTERDVIDRFVKEGLHACYLGLWKEPEKCLFARTSLSSKMSTYLAAGLPVIVDGPKDSAAWQLLGPYDAGVLLDDDANRAVAELNELFGNRDAWRRKAAGAQRLCRERLDLDQNMEKFMELLARTARKKVNGEQLA